MIVDIPLQCNNIRGELLFQLTSRDNRGYSCMTRAGENGVLANYCASWFVSGDCDEFAAISVGLSNARLCESDSIWFLRWLEKIRQPLWHGGFKDGTDSRGSSAIS